MNSTLQRIENLEKTVAKLEGQLATILALSTRVPNLEQTLNVVNKNSQSLIDQANRKFAQQDSMIQTVANQNVSLEQSVLKMGQIFTALSETLIDAKVVTSESVTSRLTQIQDDAERERIKNMLTYKAITTAEAVSNTSIVVANESVQAKKEGEEATVKQLSSYRVLEMGSQYNDPKIVEQFVGKKAGDVVTVEVDSGTVSLEIKEIYNFADKISNEAQTEEVAAEEQASPEQTPAT